MRVRNDKYPFEACATGNTCFIFFFLLESEMISISLRHTLLGATLGGDTLLGKLAFHFVKSNNIVNSSQVY